MEQVRCRGPLSSVIYLEFQQHNIYVNIDFFLYGVHTKNYSFFWLFVFSVSVMNRPDTPKPSRSMTAYTSNEWRHPIDTGFELLVSSFEQNVSREDWFQSFLIHFTYNRITTLFFFQIWLFDMEERHQSYQSLMALAGLLSCIQHKISFLVELTSFHLTLSISWDESSH